jgi:dienelactone hydrolase
MVYDTLKATDYLAVRSDVDDARIASLGLSMGSTMAWRLSDGLPRGSAIGVPTVMNAAGAGAESQRALTGAQDRLQRMPTRTMRLTSPKPP